jgi:hypothetical protein
MVGWVEAKLCPFPYGHRHSRRDRRANQQVCPDPPADSDPPCLTVFFDDSSADIVGHSITECFTNKANNIYSLGPSGLSALACIITDSWARSPGL